DTIPHERQAVANAVLILARPTANPALRRVRRETYSKGLWVPFNVKDTEIDLDGPPKNDSERVNLLIRHAVKRLERPVNSRDLNEELKLYPELKLARHKSMNVLLSQQLKITDVNRIWHWTEWYYYIGNKNSVSANAYIKLKALESEWKNLNVAIVLDDVDNCLLKTVAYGRCMLIKNTADKITPILRSLQANKKFGEVVNTEAKVVLEEITPLRSRIESWLSNNRAIELELPQHVDQTVAGLTPEELWRLLQPLYPETVKTRTITDLSNLLGDDILRFRNPFYKPSFCNGKLETVPYLYDRTDAFIYAARKWGGVECSVQAAQAASNLGQLRDVRFVLAGICSKDYNDRLLAVACLAFLQAEGTAERLAEVCINDVEAGVRESALWAYGFVGGSINKLISKMERTEKNRRVMDFANELRNFEPIDFWFV
ncbi:MAG: HEAT repeat domain-containing protein, partial [Pyrinomonadaceae bacterium]|nr:HEAT repeat domain-containing protein [Pyrinomonadaceae bacterium]